MTFTVVQRPRGTSNVPQALIDALIKTKDDGTAVQLTLPNNGDFVAWQANVRAKLRNDHNLRLRTKHNKVTRQVTCWAESFADQRSATQLTEEQLGVADGADDDTDEENTN